MATKEGVGAYPLNSNFVYRQTVLPLSYKVGTSSYNQTSQDFAALLRDWTFVEDPVTHQGSCSFNCEGTITQDGESASPSAAIDFVLDSVIDSVLATNMVGSTVFPCEAGIKPTTKTVMKADITTTTANETSYTSNSFTPVADDWLIVVVLSGNTDGDIVSLTDSQSIGFTEVGVEGVGAQHSIHVFKSNSVASPTPMTVTFNSEGATGCAIYVARVGGTNRNVVQFASTTAGVNSLNMPYNLNTDNLVFAIAGQDVNPANVNPPTGFTELEGIDTGFDTPSIGMAVSYSLEGNSGDSVITWPSSFYSQIAFEIGTISADATTRFGAVGMPAEAIITSAAGFIYSDIMDFCEEGTLANGAGIHTMDNSSILTDDSIVGVAGNLVINNRQYYDNDSIITSLGGMAVSADTQFNEESIINSFAGITITGTSQFDDEANTGVTGNIQFNTSTSFDEEGIVITNANMAFGYIDLRFDQEAIITGAASIEGTSEVLGTANYDLEAIITSTASIQFNSALTFTQETILGNSGAISIGNAHSFNTEGTDTVTGQIIFSPDINPVVFEAQLGGVGNTVYGPYQDMLGEAGTGITGNLGMTGSQIFECEIQIFSNGTTTVVSIVSGAVEILLEGQTAQTGNIELGQAISFDNEAVLTNTYSVDIGAAVSFPTEGITDISSTALMGGMVVFENEVQLTATNESAVNGAVVILLEAQLTADGLRQMVSNQFSVTTNLTRAFHVDLTINRTFPVTLTINMGRSI